MRLRISVFVIAALVVTAATAQPAIKSGITLTLGEAVAKGQLQAPALQGAHAAMQVAEANVQLSGMRPIPTLSFEAENVMGTGRYTGFGGGEKTTSLSIPLELGGKRQARVRVAEAERAVTSLGAQSVLADVTLQLTEAFITLAANERRLTVDRAGSELADRAFAAARARVHAGKVSPIEEQRADVLRINANVRVGRAGRAVELARTTLARLTGAPSPVTISANWFDVLDPPEIAGTSERSLSIATAEAEVAASSARVDAAQRDRMPDVTVMAGVRRYGESRDKAGTLGLSIPLPLFNRGTAGIARSLAEVDRAEAARNAAAQEFEQAFARAQAEVEDGLAGAHAATGPALAAAEEAARIARIGYDEGKFPQLEMIEAERSLAETREAAIDALAALHVARARLARLRGQNMPIYKD